MSAAENRKVAAWNAKHAVGTNVAYWSMLKRGEPTGTGRTRSEASIVGGAACVFIEGVADCIALSHVEARP